MRRILLWLLSFFPDRTPERVVVFRDVPLKPDKKMPPSLYLRMTQAEEAPTAEMKGKLMDLIRHEDWKWFEQYLGWKMGVATREMMGPEGYHSDQFARDRRVEVGAWSEISVDMLQFWADLQREEAETAEEKKERKSEESSFEVKL